MLKLKYRGIELTGFSKEEKSGIVYVAICEECAEKYKSELEIKDDLEFSQEASCCIAECENYNNLDEVKTSWIQLPTDEVIFTEE